MVRFRARSSRRGCSMSAGRATVSAGAQHKWSCDSTRDDEERGRWSRRPRSVQDTTCADGSPLWTLDAASSGSPRAPSMLLLYQGTSIPTVNYVEPHPCLPCRARGGDHSLHESPTRHDQPFPNSEKVNHTCDMRFLRTWLKHTPYHFSGTRI